jgi:hypothetical protein
MIFMGHLMIKEIHGIDGTDESIVQWFDGLTRIFRNFSRNTFYAFSQ